MKLLALWLAVLAGWVNNEQEAVRTRIFVAPPEIEMGGSYQSCIEGLAPGMSVDVWYRRPNFANPEVKFDWQDHTCATHTLDSGWNKDVGVWEIIAVRLHPKGEYRADWEDISIKVTVRPDAKLKPEFELSAGREFQTSRLVRKLMVGGLAFFAAFFVLPVFVVKRIVK